jgi:hypothetical protein
MLHASNLDQLSPDLLQHVAAAKKNIASFTKFNIDEVSKASQQPLKVVSLAAFLHFGLEEKLTLHLTRLSAFAEAIEGLYRCVHVVH